ncbi:MAG TPA: ABC transporter ATP-binding protein [Vicinamibacterales bacterium]|nr:ABC transporter ATP-binding protein [Vicinamibacterales bacterium]
MSGTRTHPALALRDVGKRFEANTALEGVTFDVEAGTFVSIVGPSGCGKSTLLHIIAGLLPPSAGRVEVFGESLAGINRRASYMFQQDALLPWKTVLENIQLGLTLRRQERHVRRANAQRWLERVGLTGVGNEYPYQLSGGMRKRVALAQCWIVDPDLILMDEPFSALDVHTRLQVEAEILRLWAGSGKTVAFVTHDLEEAISLSDYVFLLSAGPGSRVVGRYAVDLPRPRTLMDIRAESRFHELYRDIWHDLRREVVRSNERSR